MSESETLANWINETLRTIGRLLTVLVVASIVQQGRLTPDLTTSDGQWIAVGYGFSALWLLCGGVWLRLLAMLPFFATYWLN
jgi:hypothetical protein